ncbi:MAG: YeiH family protein [Bacillota bacterium]|jgi:uncharacterized integral membrane protein (TIGR00698 family)
MNFLRQKGGGILLAAAIAAAASALSASEPGGLRLGLVGAPVFAIAIGMALTMIFPALATSPALRPGIAFTSKKILQGAVVLLGFGLNLGTVAAVGARSLPVIAATILTSLAVAYALRKALSVDGKTACLIGVGSSICGGSAIAAAAPVIGASDEDIARSISVIFFFNVIAALIFPVLGYRLGLGSEGFAVFAGTAVNDTSSVTAAAAAAENIYGTGGILAEAVTVKLTRTLAIIPITLVLAFYRLKKGQRGGGVSVRKVFPTFILFFAAASLLTTVAGLLPESGFTLFCGGRFVAVTKALAKFCIAMAMAAVGLNSNLISLVRKGGRPILLGLCCWLAISVVSLLVQYAAGLYYADL